MVQVGNQLEVITDTVVDRVVLEQGPDGLRAVGVDVINSDSSTRSHFKAKREVIISAGSYCSPAILLRSGLGSRADLEQLGIPCQIDLVGVGKNLLDHLVSTPGSELPTLLGYMCLT